MLSYSYLISFLALILPFTKFLWDIGNSVSNLTQDRDTQSYPEVNAVAQIKQS